MREFEFRAWDTVNQVMEHNVHQLDSLNEILHKEKYKIMQWTGLYDRNKKKIFEGDLLKGHDNFIYRVWSVAGGFAINVHVDKFKNDIKLDYPFPLQPLADEQTVSYVESQCEVIGNVFENTELLV